MYKHGKTQKSQTGQFLADLVEVSLFMWPDLLGARYLHACSPSNIRQNGGGGTPADCVAHKWCNGWSSRHVASCRDCATARVHGECLLDDCLAGVCLGSLPAL